VYGPLFDGSSYPELANADTERDLLGQAASCEPVQGPAQRQWNRHPIDRAAAGRILRQHGEAWAVLRLGPQHGEVRAGGIDLPGTFVPADHRDHTAPQPPRLAPGRQDVSGLSTRMREDALVCRPAPARDVAKLA
jgi:hypothetical protein